MTAQAAEGMTIARPLAVAVLGLLAWVVVRYDPVGLFGPRQNYACLQELEADENLKRELFTYTRDDAGFGRHMRDLRRPVTVDEITCSHWIMRRVTRDRLEAKEAGEPQPPLQAHPQFPVKLQESEGEWVRIG